MRVIIHDTMTGEPIREMPFTDASWSSGVCRADEGSATFPGYVGLDLYQYMVPRKFSLSILEDDGLVRAAGPLTIPEAITDRDGINKVVMPIAGIESIFSRRYILPYPYWPLVDSAGFPIASRDTRIVGVEYGTMIKQLYAQAMSHPGGSLPVEFELDRPGTREKAWAAVDGKPVQDAVDDISELIGGVEWDWVARLDEQERLSWTLVTGTDSAPEITSDFVHTWQSGGRRPSVSELTMKVSPEFMNQTAIFTGGKEDDRVMVARASGSDLIDAGVPLIEEWDSSHSSVSVQSTLDGWAQKARVEGATPVQYWSLTVRAEAAAGLRHGDWCVIDVSDHWIIPEGSYTFRVVEVSGSSGEASLNVTVGGNRQW